MVNGEESWPPPDIRSDTSPPDIDGPITADPITVAASSSANRYNIHKK